MNQKALSKVSFKEGPYIGVHFLSKQEGLKITLIESTEFYAAFFTEVDEALYDTLLRWLEAYGKGISYPLDFLPRQKTPRFTENVLKALSLVPFGKVISYSELASLAGSPKAVRAVGTVCRLNQYPLFIPCHRVISKSGSLGGFAFGASIKTTLLEFEEKKKPTE